MPPRIVLALLLLAAAEQGGAINFDLSDDDVDDSDTCLPWLEAIVPEFTYREMFSPVLDGTYKLRAIDGSGFLGEDSASGIRVRSSGELDEKRFHWRIKRLQTPNDFKDMPAFSIWNKHSGKYLAVVSPDQVGTTEDGDTHDTQWYLRIGPSAFKHASVTGSLSYALANRAHGPYARVVEDGVHVLARQNFTLNPDFTLNLEDTWLAFGWELEQVSGHRLMSRFRARETGRQWKLVEQTPVLRHHLTRLTWKYICPDSTACGRLYRLSRDRLAAYGRLDENSFSEVTDSRVRGMCDWDIVSQRELVKNVMLMREIKIGLKGECQRHSFIEFSNLMKLAIENVCFSECMAEIDAFVGDSTELCTAGTSFNWQDWITQLLGASPKCGQVLPDTLQVLVEHKLKQVCWTWVEPSLLWSEDDKMADDLALYDYAATCSVFHAVAEESKDPRDIVRDGMCPEGTSCMCPQTWALSRLNTGQYRQSELFFVTEGAAELPSLLAALASQSLTQVATTTLPAAIAAGTLATFSFSSSILSAPVIMAALAGVVGSLFTRQAQWRCRQTVGCWPHQPKKVSGMCRMPEEAQAGGSPVWFLPPPNLRFAHQGSWGSCKLESCKAVDVEMQMSGFTADKRGVNNCQPLTFELMNGTLRTKFLEVLIASGMGDEYDFAAARAMAS